MSADPHGPGEEIWFDQLTGLRSSKPSFYPEYRRKAEGLDRTVETFARVSAALCATTSGAHSLAHAVVEALAARYDRSWVAMVVTKQVFPDQVAWLVASTPAGRQSHEWADLPADLRMLADAVGLAGQPTVRTGARRVNPRSAPPWLADRLGAPMRLRGELVGALVVLLRTETLLDQSDVSVVQALASQAAVAIENACLYDETRRTAAELEEGNRLLRQAQRQLQVAREHQILHEERHRIAQELHDNVAQHLISIGMHLEWCRTLQDRDSPVEARLALAKELARAAVHRIRATIFELSSMDRPAAGDLPGSLAQLAEAIAGPVELPVTVTVRGGQRHVTPAVEQALCQIAQEALHNVVRHARATTVRVRLTSGPERLGLAVADDGHGDAAAIRRRLAEPPARHAGGYHLGLPTMMRRATDLGGALSVVRTAGGGVTVRVTVPAARA